MVARLSRSLSLFAAASLVLLVVASAGMVIPGSDPAREAEAQWRSLGFTSADICGDNGETSGGAHCPLCVVASALALAPDSVTAPSRAWVRAESFRRPARPALHPRSYQRPPARGPPAVI